MNIGYYAHHHGSGHCQKAGRLATWLAQLGTDTGKGTPLTVMTSAKYAQKWLHDKPNINLIHLADEDPTSDDVYANQPDPTKPNFVHYNPVGNPDIQTRSCQILTAVQNAKLDVVIVDLSVEVATLCRVASVPYLYVRLPGYRNDTPHLEAFRGAQALLAFFPPELENDTTRDWVKQKTIYLGFVLAGDSNDDLTVNDTATERQALKQQLNCPSDKLLISVISGYGGNRALTEAVSKMQQRLLKDKDNLHWAWLGAPPDDHIDSPKPTLDWQGEVNNVAPFMAFSDWVISATGMTTVAEMQRFPEVRWTVVAEPRHFDEQADTASQLIAGGYAMNVEQTIEALFNLQNWVKSSSILPDLPRPVLSSDHCTDAVAFFRAMATTSSVRKWVQDMLPSFIHQTAVKPTANNPTTAKQP